MTLGDSSSLAEAPADSIKVPETNAALAPTTEDYLQLSPGRLPRQVLSSARATCYVQEDESLLLWVQSATDQVSSQACTGTRVIIIALATQQVGWECTLSLLQQGCSCACTPGQALHRMLQTIKLQPHAGTQGLGQRVTCWDTLQGSDASSVSTAASMPQAAAGAPGSVRKKRITRRVGYARDADDEESLPKPKLPAVPGECLLWRRCCHPTIV